jgi:hypothetical protein
MTLEFDILQITDDTLAEGTAIAAIYVRIQKWNYHFFTVNKRYACLLTML